MRALLDVNVLIALLDAAHVHHGTAIDWLNRQLRHGWASCPITQATQAGCIRIMSQPAYPGPLRAADVAARLTEAAAGPAHVFWPAAVDLLLPGSLDWTRVLGHRQVTDAYLLAVAVQNQGRLVTLDKRIRHDAVPDATPQHLAVID